MTKTIIENESAAVSNLIEKVKNEVVEKATGEIFEQMMQLEILTDLAEIISGAITYEMKDASFMTQQLELTQMQRSRDQYFDGISKRERTQRISEVVSVNLKAILEEMLSSLAKEVNRGALINAVAVAADTKNEKYNKIELNTSKNAGDITIPTRCIVAFVNCIELIKNSIQDKIEDAVIQKNQE